MCRGVRPVPALAPFRVCARVFGPSWGVCGSVMQKKSCWRVSDPILFHLARIVVSCCCCCFVSVVDYRRSSWCAMFWTSRPLYDNRITAFVTHEMLCLISATWIRFGNPYQTCPTTSIELVLLRTSKEGLSLDPRLGMFVSAGRERGGSQAAGTCVVFVIACLRLSLVVAVCAWRGLVAVGRHSALVRYTCLL